MSRPYAPERCVRVNWQVKRIALDPVKFKLIRMIKFRLKVQAAQRAGQPVPINTPELEAIGIMSYMLSLM